MSKVQNFAHIAPNIGFSKFDFYDLYKSTLENSELGRMKKLLPLHLLAENFELVRKELSRVRTATAMESSFGTQKELYDLRRVKARTKLTEILYIFFGTHGKRGAVDRQNRAESTAGACLKRKYAHRTVLSQENYASVIANRQIIRPKRP